MPVVAPISVYLDKLPKIADNIAIRATIFIVNAFYASEFSDPFWTGKLGSTRAISSRN
jgi:hypothetical protein